MFFAQEFTITASWNCTQNLTWYFKIYFMAKIVSLRANSVKKKYDWWGSHV
jgi:hypothetical protein